MVNHMMLDYDLQILSYPNPIAYKEKSLGVPDDPWQRLHSAFSCEPLAILHNLLQPSRQRSLRVEFLLAPQLVLHP
jgi:hypothetical protein